MVDVYTEVTTEGVGSRLMGSIKGVLVGILFFIASFPLLWMNEGCAVRTAKSLDEGASVVASVPADKIDAANGGKLVHVSGRATTDETLVDPDFGVAARGIKLSRKVEMYQWKEEQSSETTTNTGGSETTRTTYTYKKDWSESIIDFTHFKIPQEHVNPSTMAFQSRTAVAGSAKLGAFRLSPELVGRISGAGPLEEVPPLPEQFRGRAVVSSGGFYFGLNPATPQVGDLRVTFSLVRPCDVSVVGRQTTDGFEPYHAKAGNDILMLSMGTHSAGEMFAQAQKKNTILTWVLRLGGFLLMTIGLSMVFAPLAVLGDVLPFLGKLLRGGTFLCSAVVAAGLSLVTIAIAWVFYRPVLAVALFAVAGVLGYLGFKWLARRRAAKAAAAAASAPAGSA